MTLNFSKYQGTGNDFILIDNRLKIVNKDNYELIANLCDRKFGIGADGLMLLENHSKYDFEMRYYNSDGREASMCGNGGRCIVAFAHKLNIFDTETEFMAVDGYHKASLTNDNNKTLISLKMLDVSEIEQGESYFYLNTGSPHYVQFIKDSLNFDTFTQGKKIRYNNRFKEEGTNVNFVKKEKDYIEVFTYERGVEDETLSCGTGVVASALSCYLVDKKENNYSIKTKGGVLSVEFEYTKENKFINIWLNGPACHVFDGKIKI